SSFHDLASASEPKTVCLQLSASGTASAAILATNSSEICSARLVSEPLTRGRSFSPALIGEGSSKSSTYTSRMVRSSRPARRGGRSGDRSCLDDIRCVRQKEEPDKSVLGERGASAPRYFKVPGG